MSNEVCGDDRFELIGKAKARLLEATNIEMRPDEMAVIDNILFRCWQMGWLDQLRDSGTRYHELFGTPERAARTLATTARCLEPMTICRHCMYKSYCDTQCDYDSLLELLRGDA